MVAMYGTSLMNNFYRDGMQYSLPRHRQLLRNLNAGIIYYAALMSKIQSEVGPADKNML